MARWRSCVVTPAWHNRCKRCLHTLLTKNTWTKKAANNEWILHCLFYTSERNFQAERWIGLVTFVNQFEHSQICRFRATPPSLRGCAPQQKNQFCCRAQQANLWVLILNYKILFKRIAFQLWGHSLIKQTVGGWAATPGIDFHNVFIFSCIVTTN